MRILLILFTNYFHIVMSTTNVCSEYIPDVESLRFWEMLWPLTGMKPPVRRMTLNRPDLARCGHWRYFPELALLTSS